MLGSTHPTALQPCSGLLLPAWILVQETQKQLLNVNWKNFALAELMNMLKTQASIFGLTWAFVSLFWVVLIDLVYYYGHII